MKSPRRVTLSQALIEKNNISTAPPPPDSLFWTMWNACTPIAEAALATPFVQQIAAGTLDPVAYGAFNVSDAYYSFHGADDYAGAVKRATDPTLKAFLMAKHHTYESYNASFPTTWRVKSPASVEPYDITRQYSAFESQVVSQDDPIYALVVMLPCEYLWAWLGAALSPPAPHNLYAAWINGNVGAQGAYAMGNFLATYQAAHPDAVDPQKALQIYTHAMTYEQQNFEGALPAPTSASAGTPAAVTAAA